MAEPTTIANAETITHYSAHIHGVGYWNPQRSTITGTMLLLFANHGYTPEQVTPSLQARADRIKAALLAGKMVVTKTAEISPLTTADFRAGRLTPMSGMERI